MINLNLVKKLNLPVGEFVIFGSGFFVVKGIREAHDIDIIVKKDLWDRLIEKYPDKKKISPLSKDEYINLDEEGIEIYKEWIHLYGEEEDMIDSAEIIDNLPFARVEYLKRWKEKMGRDKDKKDLELLAEYEKSQK